MKPIVGRISILVVVLGVAVVFVFRRGAPPPALAPATTQAPLPPESKTKAPAARQAVDAFLNPAQPVVNERVVAAEKKARIEKIKKDYDDLALKLGAEFSAAGAAFPGGFNAYLRQLALLEREKRNDFAAILTPLELENLELAETRAGKMVQQRLGETSASEDQRREVFRLQREFDDKFALIFDLAPAALAKREAERLEVQDRILAHVGPEMSAAWLRGEGPEFAPMAEFVQQQGLPPDRAIELWRVKSRLMLRNLEIAAQPNLPAAQQAAQRNAAAVAARNQVLGIVGSGALDSAPSGVFGWLRPRN